MCIKYIYCDFVPSPFGTIDFIARKLLSKAIAWLKNVTFTAHEFELMTFPMFYLQAITGRLWAKLFRMDG